MNIQKFNIDRVVQGVINGTLQVSSIEEFDELLQIRPKDPKLYRKYADFLLHKSHLEQAVKAFERTTDLFVDKGMSLQAIVAKILQWSIRKPSHKEGRAFHAMLKDHVNPHTPLQHFWEDLTYTELITVMLRLVRVHIEAGDKITSINDPADDIFFVVSGTLAETLSPECQVEAAKAGMDTEPVLLGANDIFGDIFPLDRSTANNKEIVAITNVELVKISKSALLDACRKHPNIKAVLAQMYKPENRETCHRSWQSVRKAVRHRRPTRVKVSSLPSQLSIDDWQYSGIAVDISLSGACLDMGNKIPDHNHFLRKGEIVVLNIDLINEVATLNLSGRIVWVRKDESEHGLPTYIGIQFDPLVSTDRELLVEYCREDIGEQNLLWGLWDSMVRTDNP